MTDQELCIKTSGIQTNDRHSYYNHRYEPTSYELLEILFEECPINSLDRFVDFGCGKGRLNFYVNWCFQCNTIGIELNTEYYQDAINNLNSYLGPAKNKIQFECVPAQGYLVEETDNIFYFFNPFSIEIFRQVLSNILDSLEDAPRTCKIILYYPDTEYTYYLENYTCFTLTKEIQVPGSSDTRESFCIYTNDIYETP